MNKILRSAVFTDVCWARTKVEPQWDMSNSAAICVGALIPPSMRVVIVGGAERLGNWQPCRGLALMCSELPKWYLPVDKIDIAPGDQFKFVIVEDLPDGGLEIVAWEGGENRVWSEDTVDCGDFRCAPQFQPRLSGVAIPLFSIRSAGCEGIGDFTSLGDMAQWAAATSMRVVQILPVNDTTITHSWRDSYPYKAISVFALHPLYIRVSEIDSSVDVSSLTALEGLGDVDYDSVDRVKWRLFGELYSRLAPKCFADELYQEFYRSNREWLDPYAVFCCLRDRFSTADFSQWAPPFNLYSKQIQEQVLQDNAVETGFYFFLQFHAHCQLRAARQRAHRLGVVFKGDIPIGVSRHSVDVWVDPHLFNLNGQAGAPPDEFSIEGQNWGFPTYNWPGMASDGYGWWRRRFAKMADYFDMYRIDHILGFFRIWEIPIDQRSGLMGHFVPSLPFSRQELADWGLPMFEQRYIGVDDRDTNTLFVRDHTYPDMYHPRIAAHSTGRYQNTLDDYEKDKFNALYTHYFYYRHNDFWAGQALAKLPSLIGSTKMLCCAEDLGMIAHCVAPTLGEMQILTLEVERMSKDPSVEFARPSGYPYSSVATTSTHDMSPLRLWWGEDMDKTQRFYNEVMGWHGEAPKEATVEVCRNIIIDHLASPAMAVILPLQDWLSLDARLRSADPSTERINIPGDRDHYWRYRMHLSVEQLLSENGYNSELRELIATYVDRY